MQNAAFAARGLDWVYLAVDVSPERLSAAVEGLAALGFAGANVTAPHKAAVAELVGGGLPSVNTLVRREERLEGFSTDAAILAGLSAERPVVVGAGGAAAAFLQALPQARVFSRRGDWPPQVHDADLVVNATPVRDEVLLEVSPGQTLVDLPYPRSATAAAAARAGARVLDGLEVLVAQGAASFELWTGVPAPVSVMRRALGLPA
jgi:shikimate dehydrogenase